MEEIIEEINDKIKGNQTEDIKSIRRTVVYWRLRCTIEGGSMIVTSMTVLLFQPPKKTLTKNLTRQSNI